MRQIVVKLNPADTDGGLRIGKGTYQAAWILLFAAFYMLRDMAGVRFPDIIFTGICAGAFLMSDIGMGVGIYMFTSALTVPHNEIRIVYILITAVKLLLSGKLRFHAGTVLPTLGVMLLQIVNVTMFGTGSMFSSVYDFVVKMLVFVLPVIWAAQELSPRDWCNALLCYTAGVMLGGLAVLVLSANADGWDAVWEGTSRLGQTTDENTVGMQTTYNANQLSIMFALVVAIVLVLMDKKRLAKIPGFAVMGISLVIMVLTRSRTGILLLGVIVVVYYWVTVFRRGKIFRGILLFAAMAVLVAVVANAFPAAVEVLTDRFVDQEDITNGRVDLFWVYLEAWSSNLWCFLFGYGIGSYHNVVHAEFSPHNVFTDILICWGVTGLVLLGILLVYITLRTASKVPKKDRTMAFLPALVAAVSLLGGQYVTTGYPHMRLCFLLLAAGALASEDRPQSPKGDKS